MAHEKRRAPSGREPAGKPASASAIEAFVPSKIWSVAATVIWTVAPSGTAPKNAIEPCLAVVGDGRPEVEALRGRLLEDRQRVGDRRLAGADVPFVELEGGSAVDLEDGGRRRSRDRRPRTDPAPAGLDAERERQRAREQQDRQRVAGEDVARELATAVSDRVASRIARRRAATDDRDAGAEGRPEGIEDHARLDPADRRQDDAQPRRELGLGRCLRDGLPRGGDGSRGEVAPEPDHDVDRIRREQGQRHGVLAEAQHRGHLAAGARAGELDPGVACSARRRSRPGGRPPRRSTAGRPWGPLRRDRHRTGRRPPRARSRGRRRRCGRRPSGTWPEDTPPAAVHVPGRSPRPHARGERATALRHGPLRRGSRRG